MPRGVKGSGSKPGRKTVENKTMYFVKYYFGNTDLFESEEQLADHLEDNGWNLDTKAVIYKVTACKKMKFKRPALAGMLVEA